MMQNLDYFWYRLNCTKGLGPKSIRTIHSQLKAQSVGLPFLFERNQEAAKKKLDLNARILSALAEPEDDRCHQDFRQLEITGSKIIHLDHQDYPHKVESRLGDQAPPILFCRGVASLLNTRSVAVVGSRNMSEEAGAIVKRLANNLARSGFNVVSGYAKGVDTTAHVAALEGEGTTTIVLSYGILEFSAKRAFIDLPWQRNSLVVSQFYPREKWHARNAMIRNKLVVALSDAVIIIESGPEKDASGIRSGTFDAGEAALKSKVPLFVLSPSLFSHRVEGNETLIGRGGIEITSSNAIELIEKELSRRRAEEDHDCSQERLFG